MMIDFHFTFKGNESFKKKFDEKFAQDKEITMQMIGAFGHLVMLAFNLKKEDDVSLVGFKCGQLDPSLENKDNKKVDK